MPCGSSEPNTISASPPLNSQNTHFKVRSDHAPVACGIHRHRADRSDARDRHQALDLLLFPGPRTDIPVKAGDLLIKRGNLLEQQVRHRHNLIGKHFLCLRHPLPQLRDTRDTLRRDHAELRELTPN